MPFESTIRWFSEITYSPPPKKTNMHTLFYNMIYWWYTANLLNLQHVSVRRVLESDIDLNGCVPVNVTWSFLEKMDFSHSERWDWKCVIKQKICVIDSLTLHFHLSEINNYNNASTCRFYGSFVFFPIINTCTFPPI